MIVALLIGREGSQGFPGKNIKPVMGRPLMVYPILAAKNSQYVERVYVSTDSEKIKEIAKVQGARIIDRPAELAGHKALGQDVFVHGYRLIQEELKKEGKEVELMALLHCNAPTVLASQIDRGVEILRQNPEYDSAVTVGKYNMYHPNRMRRIQPTGLLTSFVPLEAFGDPKTMSCDRDSAGDAYLADVALSLVRPKCLENIDEGLKPQQWMGQKIYPIVNEGGLDIDYEWQWGQIEWWMKKNGFTEAKTPYDNKYKVLITASYLRPVIDNYRPIFYAHKIEVVIPQVKERLSEDELLEYVGDIDGILCGDDKLTKKVLSAAPRLKVISKWGTGIDSIDKEAASALGITVKNIPDAFTDPVADIVLNYMLCLARNTVRLNEEMHQGIWKKTEGWSMKECTLGVVGMGNIGKAVVKRAQAFGMKVLANDIKEMPFDFMVPLEQLLRESDFVSLNCDLNPTSHHLINKEKLALMKPTAFLINTSRGPVVEEAALIEALQNKKIAGAGLDVFENEPLPQDSPLKNMPNVILSPHNANAGKAARLHVHEKSIRNLIEVLSANA